MSEIKAVLFDFGGTLDNDGVHWFDRLYDAVGQTGVSLSSEEFQRCANLAAHSICKLADTPTLLMHEMVLRLCEHTYEFLCEHNGHGELIWNPEQICDIFMADATPYLRRNRQVLNQLRRRYRLGCISNNWGNTAGWCRQFQLDDYFDTMVDSTVVGSAKPDARIFQVALEALDLPAEACAYVGDFYDADIVGARGVGMTAVWMTPDGDADLTDVDLAGVRCISKLTDLLDIEF